MATVEQETPTWDQLRERMNTLVTERGEWAGAPMPVEGLRLVIEPRYPYQGLNGYCFESDEQRAAAALVLVMGLDEPPEIVNSWHSWHHNAHVYIWRENGGKSKAMMLPEFGGSRMRLAMNMFTASQAWSVDAELKAQSKLKEMITPVAWQYYVLTGAFLESSKRSGVFYMFRRSRPTLALVSNSDGSDMRLLAALCLHPIGYYENSFAGAMVPTDDVIAHLVMMRGNEAKFFSKANHHPVWSAQAGL